MRFLLDHDVPADVLRVLRAKGHEVHIVAELLSRDAVDPDVLDCAAKNGLVLITCNRRDFLDLARRRPQAGLIVLVRRKSRVAEAAAVLRLLQRAGESGIAGNINFA